MGKGRRPRDMGRKGRVESKKRKERERKRGEKGKGRQADRGGGRRWTGVLLEECPGL